MASFTLTAAQIFPNGTSVGAYPRANWPAWMPTIEGAPVGSATNSQTMTNSTLTFTGLTAGTDYLAVADVGGGNYRYVRFKAGADRKASGDAAAAVSLTGTLAGRPAADATNKDYLYFASDDNGGTLYRSDGSTWTKIAASATQAAGQELGYAEITSPFTTTSTTGVDVTGLTITIPAPASGVVLLTFWTQEVDHTIAAAAAFPMLFEGASLLSWAWPAGSGAGEKQGGVTVMKRLSGLTGNHTYKMQLKGSTAGTSALAGDATAPAFLRAVAG